MADDDKAPAKPVVRFCASVMVSYCIVLHLIWAVMILIDPSTVFATPVAALFSVFKSDIVLSATLTSCAIASFFGAFTRLPWAVALMLPQQSLLIISAVGAAFAIYMSQFADGVIRPRAFIAADQIHILLAAVGHACAIVVSTYERVVRR